MSTATQPFEPFLERNGVVILDGGLATELESRGYDLNDPLWSARLLLEAPDAILRVHRDYLEAGADCIVSASYQASVAGFMKRGLTETQAVDLLCLSVDLARRARDEFWTEERNRSGRLRPLVAASIGPYGAYLANGAEYTGAYEIGEAELIEFHRKRWHILAGTGQDLFACETIPSRIEARALARLAMETPRVWAWFSFSCRDGGHLNDGTPIEEAVATFEELPQVVAVGVNCTPPHHIHDLVQKVRQVTAKLIVAYPNSGETYDAERKSWRGVADTGELATLSQAWRQAGATLLGGCCRTGPEHIRRLRAIQVTGVPPGLHPKLRICK